MKLLLFADVHGSLKALSKIQEKAKKENPDLLICAGDLSNFERGLDLLLSKLSKIGIPVLMIPGNHEGDASLKKACGMFRNLVFIHDTTYEKGGVLFFGYGGGGFASTDKGFEKSVKKHKEKLRKAKTIVLVTHQPPYGNRLDKLSGAYCGNKSYAKFVKDFKPKLAVSGHLHENAGKKDKLGKTDLINPGPEGVLVTI